MLRKSERTRAAIVEAAREIFAEQGYEGTTVRAIAERAVIDPAMIIRYFGGKDGLFAVASKVELGLQNINFGTAGSSGAAIVRHFLDLWEGKGQAMGLVILLRAAATNDSAADRIREIFAEQVLPAAERLGDPSTAPVRAGMAISQLFGLALCRYILKLPPVAGMSRDEVVSHLAPVIEQHLSGAESPYRDDDS